MTDKSDMPLQINSTYTDVALDNLGCGSSMLWLLSMLTLQIPYPHLDDNSQTTKMLKVIKTMTKKVAQR